MSMEIDTSVFKAYDIRGTYPKTINEEIVERVGKAYITLTNAKRIVVAQDMRPSSAPLKEALIKGLNALGAQVIEIGLASTDLFYFAVYHLKADGGIMVTASHNPKQYNGLKMTRANAAPIGEGSGMEQIRDLVLANTFTASAQPGGRTHAEVMQPFVEFVCGFVDIEKIAPLKVVLDPGNGMGCVVAPHILQRLKLKEIRQCFTLDGNFPNHEANPLIEENRKDIVERVIHEGADLGIAWDGDTDRCFFIDDRGRFLQGDFITGIIAKRMLAKHPGKTVLYDLRASRYVPNTITTAGGKPRMCRVGHAFFKQYMREDHAIFGGEVTGHYYYNYRNEFFADSGYIPALQILALVSALKAKGEKLSDFIDRELTGHYISGEINSTVADKDAVLTRLASEFHDGKLYYMDGLSVEYPDWHFNVRPSNTEPLLRLNLEATTPEQMGEMRDRILAIIRN